MMKKIKKIIPAVVSALLCTAMLLSVTASAEKKSTAVNIWKESKALTSAGYYSKHIKLASKYSEKDTKNTVVYDKSRMKKFADRFVKAAGADDPELSFSLIDKNSIIYFAVKGDNCKAVICFDDLMGIALYINEKKATYLSVEDKVKMTETDSSYKSDGREAASMLAEDFDFGISENAKGKIFKIKSDEKIYYYEEFESDYYVVGMLFSEKGNPLAIVVDDEVYCISFKTKVADSEFSIPKGYKEVDYDDFDLF